MDFVDWWKDLKMNTIPAHLIQVIPLIKTGDNVYAPDYSELGVEDRVRYDCEIAEWEANPPSSSLEFLLRISKTTA